MFRELRWRMKVVSMCPVDVYVPSYNASWWFPYKLQKAKAADDYVRESCLKYMVDCGIHEGSENADVIAAATRHNAHYVIPRDYLSEPDRTSESVREFLDLYEESDCPAQVIIPLQPDHLDHLEDFKGYSHYAIGGVSEAGPQEQVESLKRVREAVGYGPYIHGFGFNVAPKVIQAVRDDPRLVDSIDFNLPEGMTGYGEITDATLQRIEFTYPHGDSATAVRGLYALALATMTSYMMSPLCDGEDIPDLTEQSVMDWG